MTRIHLIDALPYVFRAYFSIPATMRAPDGRPVHAVYGFAMFLTKLFEDDAVTHAAVAFDESLTSSFRNEFHAGYKSSRELPPPELEAQLKDCQEVARLAGAFVTASARYEADDLLATLARRLDRDGNELVVVSGDKDLAQLVNERTVFYDYSKNERLDAAGVLARHGVLPKQIPDLLGLMGDSVDDIPGVPGVGPKTASALIAHFGSAEAVYERLGEIASLPIRGAKTLAAKLEPHRDIAMLSKRLATVHCECPIDADLAALAIRPPDAEAIGVFCESRGFKGLKSKLSARRG